MKTVRWAVVISLGLAAGLLSSCGTPPPTASVQHSAVLGSTGETVSIRSLFHQGRFWWRRGAGPWQQSSWAQPPSRLPIPLRDTLGWTQALVSGEWPGSPVPTGWADWAGHIQAPVGWVIGADPANGGPPHPLTVTVFLPEKAPYQGYGVLSVFWSDAHGRWHASVSEPKSLPASTNLNWDWAGNPRHRPVKSKG